jgi:hypothetical protein
MCIYILNIQYVYTTGGQTSSKASGKTVKPAAGCSEEAGDDAIDFSS